MVKSGLATLLIGLALFRATAQGTFEFTWHGQSNYFQASFQITEAETAPGVFFSSPLFTNSISISSLDGLTYQATTTPNPIIGGYFEPLNLTIILIDQATLSRIEAVVVPGQGASISENSPLPNGFHGETGFWTYDQTPEPSPSALLALGTIVLTLKHLAGRNP